MVKDWGKIPLVLVVLLGIMLFFYIISRQEMAQLKSDMQKLEENFKFLQNNYNNLIEENQKLAGENKFLKQESAALSSKMRNVEVEVSKAEDKLNEFQVTVEDSIQWFKDNIK